MTLVLLAMSTAVASASAGEVFGFGENYYGQLGIATNNLTDFPNPSPALVSLPGAVGPVVRLAAGNDHSLALTSTGQLYSFGANRYGQLGIATNSGTGNANPTPALVGLPGAGGPVVQVAAGRRHSLALTSTGQLYAFGLNYSGQLGNATKNLEEEPNPTPTLVSLPGASGPIVQIAAGRMHSLALTSTGQLYAFGDNNYGQLGNATNNGTGNPNPTPTLVSLPGASGPVVQIAAGSYHSLAVTSTGQLYSFGLNYYGQLGNATNTGKEEPNPTPTQVSVPGATGPVVQIAAGRLHSLALTSTGQLYAFGENYVGELGNTTNNGTGAANPIPAIVGLPGATGPVVQFAAGEHDTLAITSAGQLYAFGENYFGQLGTATNNGKEESPNLPAQVAFPFSTTIDTVAKGPEAEHTLVSATIAAIPLAIAPAAPPVVVAGKAPTPAQLKAGLLAQLGATGKSAKIGALLKSKSYSLSFKALSAGTLVINWYFLPRGAHLAKKAKAKPVLLASGKLSFKAPGTKKLTIKLTGKGQKLLKRRNSIKLTAKGSFTPTGNAAVTAKKGLTLKR